MNGTYRYDHDFYEEPIEMNARQRNNPYLYQQQQYAQPPSPYYETHQHHYGAQPMSPMRPSRPPSDEFASPTGWPLPAPSFVHSPYDSRSASPSLVSNAIGQLLTETPFLNDCLVQSAADRPEQPVSNQPRHPPVVSGLRKGLGAAGLDRAHLRSRRHRYLERVEALPLQIRPPLNLRQLGVVPLLPGSACLLRGLGPTGGGPELRCGMGVHRDRDRGGDPLPAAQLLDHDGYEEERAAQAAIDGR